MAREIFELQAKVVDANGTYNNLTGYPVAFDSKNYGDDIEKTQRRAEGAWHEVIGAMMKRDDRQVQMAMLIRISDAVSVLSQTIGTFPEPQPEPEPEE